MIVCARYRILKQAYSY